MGVPGGITNVQLALPNPLMAALHAVLAPPFHVTVSVGVHP